MVKKESKKYRFELSRFGMIISVFVFLFIAGWMFVLGIMFGQKQMSDSMPVLTDLKKSIEPAPLSTKIVPAQEPPKSKKEEPDPKLDFYEVLAKQKEGPQKPPAAAVTPPKEESAPAAGSNRVKFEDLRREKTIHPAQATLSPPKAQPVPEAPANGQYTIQLASLENKDKAEKMVQGLMTRGHTAYYYQVKIEGKVFYRVRCGKFMTRKEADVYAIKLVNEDNLQGFVTKMD